MELLFVMVVFCLGGAAIGAFWRWHLAWLLVLCAVLGFAISLAMRDWSDFDFSVIAADAHRGGGAWVSWVVWLLTLFILFAVPAGVGGSVGFVLRQKRRPSRQ